MREKGGEKESAGKFQKVSGSQARTLFESRKGATCKSCEKIGEVLRARFAVMIEKYKGRDIRRKRLPSFCRERANGAALSGKSM